MYESVMMKPIKMYHKFAFQMPQTFAYYNRIVPTNAWRASSWTSIFNILYSDIHAFELEKKHKITNKASLDN
jgi:hypothetical protein